MKKLVYLALGVTLLLSPFAFAKPAKPSNATQVFGNETLRDLEGTYALQNGGKARLSVENDRLYIQLNRYDVFELVPRDGEHFATRDNKLIVEKTTAGSGETAIVVQYGADFKPAYRHW